MNTMKNSIKEMSANIIRRVYGSNSPVLSIDTTGEYTVLPNIVYSDHVLYPDYAILVIKEADLAALLIGKRVLNIQRKITLDFYDERVIFFQNIRHVNHIAFVNFNDEDMIRGDFGPLAESYYKGVTKMFGDLTDKRNYEFYSRICPRNETYKFLDLKDAETMVVQNNRVLAVLAEDGTITVMQIINR